MYKYPKDYILATAADSPVIPQAFVRWLAEEFHVWEAFEAEAFKVIKAGFKHYSARTIIHVLRHHAATTESCSTWKLNNDTTPYLGRLFAIVHPQHADLFHFRTTKIERAWDNISKFGVKANPSGRLF